MIFGKLKRMRRLFSLCPGGISVCQGLIAQEQPSQPSLSLVQLSSSCFTQVIPSFFMCGLFSIELCL